MVNTLEHAHLIPFEESSPFPEMKSNQIKTDRVMSELRDGGIILGGNGFDRNPGDNDKLCYFGELICLSDEMYRDDPVSGALLRLPWTEAVIKPGDCIFVPAGYLHQTTNLVKGNKRTFSAAVSLLWHTNVRHTARGCAGSRVSLGQLPTFWYYAGMGIIPFGYADHHLGPQKQLLKLHKRLARSKGIKSKSKAGSQKLVTKRVFSKWLRHINHNRAKAQNALQRHYLGKRPKETLHPELLLPVKLPASANEIKFSWPLNVWQQLIIDADEDADWFLDHYNARYHSYPHWELQSLLWKEWSRQRLPPSFQW